MSNLEFEDKVSEKSTHELIVLRNVIERNPSYKDKKEHIRVIDKILTDRQIDENEAKHPICRQEMPHEVYIANRYVEKWQNAMDRGLEFSLTLVDMKRLLSRKRCYYTGMEMQDLILDNTKRTLDRIDNSIGYTKENTVACCYAANRLKAITFESEKCGTSMTVEQLKRMAKKL